jgi:hypothetical protein
MLFVFVSTLILSTRALSSLLVTKEFSLLLMLLNATALSPKYSKYSSGALIIMPSLYSTLKFLSSIVMATEP